MESTNISTNVSKSFSDGLGPCKYRKPMVRIQGPLEPGIADTEPMAPGHNISNDI